MNDNKYAYTLKSVPPDVRSYILELKKIRPQLSFEKLYFFAIREHQKICEVLGRQKINELIGEAEFKRIQETDYD